MTAEPCRAKDRPLHSPSNLFRPLRNPPRTLENASRALVEAPGTAPGSEELISTPFIAIAAKGGNSNIARRRDFQRPERDKPAMHACITCTGSCAKPGSLGRELPIR